uniref:protein FAM3C n=1 Tax=Semicossyphus pulcher TaxID=241346 RepID=UPI0037E739C9
MRNRGVLELVGVVGIILVIAWGLSITHNVQISSIKKLGLSNIKTLQTEDEKESNACSPPKPCPPETYSFHIWSGAANVVGPKICFDGKIVMSHVLNNIGPGLNVVVIDEKRGVVEKFDFLNMINGNSQQILEYLKNIQPGRLVLVATYDDAIPQMTNEIREAFEKMGSTMISDLKSRDSWVFAGKTGAKAASHHEKISVNDPKTNVYEDWPSMTRVGGCILKPRSGEDGSTEAPKTE